MFTEADAKTKWCHRGPAHDDMPCLGSTCMAWRWQPLQADAAFMAAVKTLEDAGTPKAKAGKMVHDDPSAYGLPSKPFRGWCGLASKPEVTP